MSDPLVLNPRLAAVAAMVLPGAPMADIGTDHAYLPVYLVAAGLCPRAVAADRMPGPLSAAERTVAAAGLTGRIDLRLGDGLAVLAPGEVATVVLAGMGGALMQRILAARPEVVARLRRLVLQPNGGAESLRRYVASMGWAIAAEEVVAEAGRLYIVMAAEPAAGPPAYEPADYILGPVLRRRGGPLYVQWVREELARTRRALAGARRAQRPDPEKLALLAQRAAVLSAAEGEERI